MSNFIGELIIACLVIGFLNLLYQIINGLWKLIKFIYKKFAKQRRDEK